MKNTIRAAFAANPVIDRRRLLLGTGATAAALALAGCTDADSDAGSTAGSAEGSATAGAATTRTETVALRYGYTATNSDLLTGIVGLAHDLGYLDEALAEVNATFEAVGFTKAGPAINSALAAGELELGGLGDVPAISAKASGAETTLISTTFNVYYTEIVVPADSEVESLEDLKGKTIAVQTGSYMQRILYQILEANDISVDEVEIANMAEVDAATAIAGGSVDAAPLSSFKALKLTLAGDARSIYSTDGVDAQRALSTTLARTDFAEEYPDVLVAFFEGVIRAEQYVEVNGVEELRQQYIDTGVDEAIIDAALDDDEDYITTLYTSDEKVDLLQDAATQLVDYGLLETEVDVYAWFDGSFYEEAAEALA